jgi:hypothetical protein
VLCSQYGRTVNGTTAYVGRLYARCHSRSRDRIPDYRLPTGCYVHIRCVYTAVLDGATSRTDTVGVLPCGAYAALADRINYMNIYYILFTVRE